MSRERVYMRKSKCKVNGLARTCLPIACDSMKPGSLLALFHRFNTWPSGPAAGHDPKALGCGEQPSPGGGGRGELPLQALRGDMAGSGGFPSEPRKAVLGPNAPWPPLRFAGAHPVASGGSGGGRVQTKREASPRLPCCLPAGTIVVSADRRLQPTRRPCNCFGGRRRFGRSRIPTWRLG